MLILGGWVNVCIKIWEPPLFQHAQHTCPRLDNFAANSELHCCCKNYKIKCPFCFCAVPPQWAKRSATSTWLAELQLHRPSSSLTMKLCRDANLLHRQSCQLNPNRVNSLFHTAKKIRWLCRAHQAVHCRAIAKLVHGVFSEVVPGPSQLMVCIQKQ